MSGTQGNKNALKHGFFCDLWTDAEKVRLTKAEDANDITGDIHLLRVMIRRIALTIPETVEKKQLETVLKTMNTLTLAISSLSTLVRTNVLANGGTLPETETAILEALTAFRLEQEI